MARQEGLRDMVEWMRIFRSEWADGQGPFLNHCPVFLAGNHSRNAACAFFPIKAADSAWRNVGTLHSSVVA